MSIQSNVVLRLNSQTSKLSLNGKSVATDNYVDELISSISNPVFTVPINQILKTANGINQQNIAIGSGALSQYNSNEDNEHNIAIGFNTLQNSIRGYNTAVGCLSLTANTTGSKNTALGHEALVNNTGGRYNTGLGKNALYNNTSQEYNTGVGYLACYAGGRGGGSIGSENTIVGANSVEFGSLGAYNSTLGVSSLRNGAGNNNVAIGYNSGLNSRKNNINTNNNNTFLGANSDLLNATNTWSSSTAVGFGSKIKASNEIVLGTSTETVRIPKFITAGVVKNDESGNLSTSKINSSDISDATITGLQLSSTIVLPSEATATTQASTDNSEKISTTAFVKSQNYATQSELNKMPTIEPTSPTIGSFWIDIENKLLKVYTGLSLGWLSFAPYTPPQ